MKVLICVLTVCKNYQQTTKVTTREERVKVLNHHYLVLINLQVQEHLPHQWVPSPGNWLAVHRADLTLVKTDICVFAAKEKKYIPYFKVSM